MRILFVSNPVVDNYGRPNPHVPLGLIALATVLHQSGIDSEIMDSNAVGTDPLFREVAEAIMATDPDVIGFSTLCHNYHTVLRLARQCKEIKPEVQVILGGRQASLVASETVTRFSQVDLVVRGECEQTIVDLMQLLPYRQALRDFPGLTFMDGNRLIVNPLPEILQDLDSLPLPDYGLFPDSKSQETMTIEVGRGCPYHCIFCATNKFLGNRVRVRSPQNLVRLLKNIIQEFGIRKFAFVHELFAVSRSWLLEFLRTLELENLNISWYCTTRIDRLDEDLLEKMTAHGCTMVAMGVETGSPRLQRLIRKNLRVDGVVSAVRQLKKKEMGFLANFVTGFPEETMEDLVQTIMLRTALRYEQPSGRNPVGLNLLVPFKGSQLYDQKENSLVLDDFHSWACAYDEQDKILIQDHPDIFFSFYHLPTPYLERNMLVRAVFLLKNLDRLLYTLFLLWQDPALGFPQSLLSSPHLLELPGEQGNIGIGELASLQQVCHFLGKVVQDLGLPEHPIYDVMDYELALLEVSTSQEANPSLVKDFSYDVVTLAETIQAENFRQLPQKINKLAHSLHFFKKDDQVVTAKADFNQPFDRYLQAWSSSGKSEP